MSPLLRRDLIAGMGAGFATALLLHGMATWDAVRAAPGGPGTWALIGVLAGDLASGAVGGGIFAAVFRYQPGSPAFSASGGLLFGLLWWILGRPSSREEIERPEDDWMRCVVPDRRRSYAN